MLWVKSFHIFFVVCWFAGIFYLPRLFVYHANTEDQAGQERFCIMERKLYRGIMMPCGILATLLGIWLIMLLPAYAKAGWFHAKMLLVILVWAYHLYCGCLRKAFAKGQNKHSHIFYRWFNEIPVIFLLGIIIFTVVKP